MSEVRIILLLALSLLIPAVLLLGPWILTAYIESRLRSVPMRKLLFPNRRRR